MMKHDDQMRPDDPSEDDVRRHEESEKRHVTLAIEADTRHSSYFLTLTFTLLAASIETARWSSHRWSTLLEVMGWGALFVSGILGLLRSERAPGFYRLAALQAQAKGSLAFIQNLTSPMSKMEQDAEQILSQTGAQISEGQRQFERHYRWQKRCFLAGVSLVIVRRAIEGFLA